MDGRVSGAGIYPSLMLRHENVTRLKDRLPSPRFGVGQIVLPAIGLPGLN